MIGQKIMPLLALGVGLLAGAQVSAKTVIDDDLRAEVERILAPVAKPEKPSYITKEAASAAKTAPPITQGQNPTSQPTPNPVADLAFVRQVDATTAAQRVIFGEFLQASAQKDYQDIARFRRDLAGYPLALYVDYAYIRDNLASVPDSQLQQFIAVHHDSFLASYVRGMLLDRLASQQNWRDFVKYDDGRKGRGNDCRRLSADIALKKAPQKTLLARASAFYLQDDSQPNECDSVFAWYLQTLGARANQAVVKRIDLALKAGHLQFAQYLKDDNKDRLTARQIATVEQKIQHINNIKRNPDLIFESRFAADTRFHRHLALLAANAMLADQLERAEAGFARLQKRYHFNAKDRNAFVAKMAKRAAQRHYDDALARYAHLPSAAYNADSYEWHARAAIRVQNWRELAGIIGKMPAKMQQSDEWRYWRARAEQHVGSLQVARQLLEQVASERSYYGFLASERLGQGYQFNNQPSQVDVNLAKNVSQTQGFARLREWLYANQMSYARVELRNLRRGLSVAEQVALAHISQEWLWYEQGVRIMAQLALFDDLPLRFPLAYRQELQTHSQAANINPDWAQAIMRRESGYAFDAKSSVGATGLMQLMPATAKNLARGQNWQFGGVADLLNPDVNIRYGTTYLGQLYSQFDGFVPLATAAYNAGPSRVNSWLPDKPMPLDVWIGTIPYPETRKYVQAVSEYMSVFQWRNAGEPDNFKRALGYVDQIVPAAGSAQVNARR